MCLTIPAQVIKIDKNKIILRESSGAIKNVSAFLSNLKKGDWVLCINDLIIKKIAKKDAGEIIKLLESAENIDVSMLDGKFKKIIQASKNSALTKKEILYLLKADGAEKEALFSEANLVRKENIKDFICIHGIIEFSNYCQNDCFYCGLRKENAKLKRYRMSVDEIVKTAEKAVKERGYKLLVLQSGEDYFYTDDMLAEIIKKIKEKCRVFIFMSIGERRYDCYEKMKKAGASGVLFRFETSNPKLFKQLHPKGKPRRNLAAGEILRGKNFKNRFEHLKFMKELGYFITTGSIIGLPGQTMEDLVNDILTIKKWANMVSMGPYVPIAETPLGKLQIPNNKSQKKLQIQNSKQKAELNLKMIAILRLLMPVARIPVTTALETLLGEEGRKRTLQAGANSLMFNLTPPKYRPLYKIYPNKFFKKEENWERYGLFKYEESYKMLEEKMRQGLTNR